MATASLKTTDTTAEGARPRRHPATPRKPPIALRPLHRVWRRTIDTVELVRVDLPVRRLAPALAGIVACQISDLHVDREEDLIRLQNAVRTINREAPDLVFLTGDYFSGPDTMRRYLGEFERALKGLTPKTGVYAIAGNHDHWSSFGTITQALRNAGARVLANAHERVAIGGGEVVIVGIDDLWSRRAEPSRAFAGVRADDCTIVLAHNPDTALYTRHLEPGVMLSGHTHGGVVRIPFYGSLIRSVLRIGKQYYAGLNRYGDFYVYTNRGLGTFWVRIRINCRPEISRFRLIPLADGAKPDATAKPRRRKRKPHPA